jgi:methionine-rich copper-binding protein CopC
MSRTMLRWTVLAIALAVVALVIATRSPSLRVVAGDPADGAVLGTAPHEVALGLTGVHDPLALHLAVLRQGSGLPVTTGTAQLRGDRLVVPVSIVDPGRYVVAYHVQLADGQQVSGQMLFSLAAPGQPTTAGRAAPQPAGAAVAHDHGSDDPLTGVFVGVDLLLTGVLITYLVRRPRLRRSSGSGPVRATATANPTGPTEGDR